MINKFLIVLIPTLVLIFSFVCCASSSNSGQETYGEEMQFMEKSYVQTFYDDFSGTKLDTKKWEKCPEWQRSSHIHQNYSRIRNMGRSN